MKLLVTGGAGFIGSALCRSFLQRRGASLVVIDKLTYAGHMSSLSPIANHPDFHFIRADICDEEAMRAAFGAHAPDAVVHLAAESHVDRSITDSSDFIDTNVRGSFVLLEAARSYWETLPPTTRARFRFHHVSTDEIFGSLESDGHFTETSRADPRSPYAASKAAADHLVSAWGHTYGLPVLISNCSNNYGPYQLPEKLIPLAVLNALEKCPVPVYGDGKHIRDWLFVEDHVEALLLILENGKPGETYNVGGRAERTNLEVVQTICDLLDRSTGDKGRRALIEFVADRPGHDRRYAMDPGKLEKTLGWRARTAFEEGLERTVHWYLNNRDWWLPLWQAGHGRRRLGLRGAVSTT